MSLCCYLQICPTLVKLCHILWHYPAISLPGFASPVTASHTLSCLVPCHAFSLPWSASTLATALLTTAQVRFYSSLALYLAGIVLHGLLWPALSSAEQTWPDISLTCRG